jgi:tetrahydromethanopterin S-methyltransferase subunit F
MFYMSFFSHLAELRADPNVVEKGLIEAGPLTLAIGVLFALTIVGLLLSLVPDRRSGR